MRLVPILTAILVMSGLYAFVFERDAVLAFARGNDPETVETPKTETAGTDVPISVERTPDIGVVVIKSVTQQVDGAVLLRGETEAARQVDVRAETSATVISDPLRKGAFVERGDLLCRLDPGTREASLAESRARLAEAKSRVPEAEAKLMEAKARLGEAEVNLRASAKLAEDGYASETRLKSSEASQRAAEAGIASAESGLEATRSGIEAAAAAVAAAEREIERLEIRAPFEGLLESDTAELGSLMQPGSLCATIIQLDPIKLVGYVPETDVNRVEVGALAGAELANGQRIQGQVEFISRSADPTTRTFRVEIRVPNPDLAIRDGQTATIGIRAAGVEAHRLPQSALTLNKDGALGVRVVGEGDIVAFRPVEMIRDDAEGIWVAGLEASENVIVVGQDFVTAGVKVKPTLREVTQ